MKGIIIAGGTGSRLYPCTAVINKHFLPVFNKPLIYYPLNTLINAGVEDIVIVSGQDESDLFTKLLDQNNSFKNVKISFVVQKEAKGIAHAVGLCEELIGEDKMIVHLGDNIIMDDIRKEVESFDKEGIGARLFLKQVDKPQNYELAEIKDDKIVNFEERPIAPISDLAVTGVFIYDNQVWQAISGVSPSVRGELELSDVNNFYLKQNILDYVILKEDWFDIDTYSVLLAASNKVAGK